MTAPQVWPDPRQVRLTVDGYLLLAASGALDPYGKTELIEGIILAMSPQHRPHARIKTNLALRLARALEDGTSGVTMLIEGSIAIPPSNAPLPDIVLTSEPDGEGLVPLASVRLIVEVADTSLAFDMGAKAAVYAANDVPEYWVVDVRGQVIHQHWKPLDGAYAPPRMIRLGERIAAETIDGLAVDTQAL